MNPETRLTLRVPHHISFQEAVMHPESTPTARTCEACGQLLVRKSDEPPSKWNVRRTCGGACKHALIGLTRVRYADADVRTCLVCGGSFERPAGMPPCQFVRKTTCAPTCRYVLTVSKRAIKTTVISCARCGKEVRLDNNRIRRGQMYCSMACQKPPRDIHTCAHCGKVFTAVPSVRHRRRFCSRLCADLGKAPVSAAPTKIERETYAALDALHVPFLRQQRLGFWVVDALIPATQTVIEVQGDYWHVNPAIYPEPTDAKQRDRRARDQQKHGWLRKNGYRVVELWESDIEKKGAAVLLTEAGITAC